MPSERGLRMHATLAVDGVLWSHEKEHEFFCSCSACDGGGVS
jgi:hypothetical protein